MSSPRVRPSAEQAIDLLEPARVGRLRARVSALLLLVGALVGVVGALTDPVNQLAVNGPSVLAGVAAVAVFAPLTWWVGPRCGEEAFAVLWIVQVLATVVTGLMIGADGRGLAVEMLLLGVTVVAAIFLRSSALLVAVTATACLGAFVLVVEAARPLVTAEAIVSITTIVVVTLMVRFLRTTAVAALLEARKLGETDHLTGLLNRHGLAEHGVAPWRESAREGAGLAVVLVDIDHFKAVNDTFGHSTGDELLRHVAVGLSYLVSAVDGLLVRHGGEEFLLVARLNLGTRAVEVAEQARTAVRHTWNVPVTVSVGVLEVWPQEDDELPERLWHAVESADAALYDAKRSGRDRVALAHETIPTPPVGQGMIETYVDVRPLDVRPLYPDPSDPNPADAEPADPVGVGPLRRKGRHVLEPDEAVSERRRRRV